MNDETLRSHRTARNRTRFFALQNLAGLAAAVLLLAPGRASAWDYAGHRVVNQIALATLPTNFPAFVLAPEAAERIAFLAGEPDRWRNTPDLTLKHSNGPDHYLDMEPLADYGLKPADLPVFRYDFIALLATERAAHPDKFPPVNPAQNSDHTRQLLGALPWSITENFGKLKSGFSCLKTFEEFGGTPAEIANARANIIYIMGVMGHYVGDGAQPLHTTIHHNGWVGANPHGYTTARSFHQWIDGGYFEKVGIPTVAGVKSSLRPAHLVQLAGRDVHADQTFQSVVEFLVATSHEVEPLYQLEKDGGLSGEGEAGLRGKEFLARRLVAGGQMLGDLWFTAWQEAPPDKYLKEQLLERQQPAAGKSK
ncbi:MAG TPA: hypothetical protein VFV96_11595 [Verrucomicrobiae bacterium]|nr:hypothetical protein [Verrucomicrobiae bacterium]